MKVTDVTTTQERPSIEPDYGELKGELVTIVAVKPALGLWPCVFVLIAA